MQCLLFEISHVKTNWKPAAFSIFKCESLIEELLNVLNKQIANEFTNFSKLDSILKGRTPEELATFFL